MSAPFNQITNTVAVNATTTPSTAAQLPMRGDQSLRVVNNSTVLAFLVVGTQAQATSPAAPVSGTPSYVLPLLPLTVETFRYLDGQYYSVWTVSSTGTLYITGGSES